MGELEVGGEVVDVDGLDKDELFCDKTPIFRDISFSFVSRETFSGV